MGFRTDAYAKVWDVKNVDGRNATDIRISISRKDKVSGEYIDDFSGYVRLYAKAHEKGAKLQKGDRIKLLSVDVTNNYNKEKNVTYTTFKVFDFEPAKPYTGSGNSSNKDEDYPFEGTVTELDEETKEEPALPW